MCCQVRGLCDDHTALGLHVDHSRGIPRECGPAESSTFSEIKTAVEKPTYRETPSSPHPTGDLTDCHFRGFQGIVVEASQSGSHLMEGLVRL